MIIQSSPYLFVFSLLDLKVPVKDDFSSTDKIDDLSLIELKSSISNSNLHSGQSNNLDNFDKEKIQRSIS